MNSVRQKAANDFVENRAVPSRWIATQRRITSLLEAYAFLWQEEKTKEDYVHMEIPRTLWKRFYLVSGEMKNTNDTFAEAQQDGLEIALIEYCEKREKLLGKNKKV